MIVTVTPNPSLDRTMEIDRLAPGTVLRARRAGVEAGGKGVNVARALVIHGGKARAVVPIGGFEGDQFLALLDGLGFEVVRIPTREPLRVNVTVIEPDGTTTKLNEPGPRLSREEVEALLTATVDAARDAEWVAVCGSLPPGMPADFVGRLTAALHDADVKVAVDSSGEPFAAALDAAPDLVKPNHEELAEATGRTLRTFGDVVAAGEGLRARGIGTVVVSLGADGAVLVDDSGSVHARTGPITPRNTVGAGDALLAGFLAAGAGGPSALAQAVTWGAAAAQSSGTSMPGPEDLHEEAALSPVDAQRPIRSTG